MCIEDLSDVPNSRIRSLISDICASTSKLGQRMRSRSPKNTLPQRFPCGSTAPVRRGSSVNSVLQKIEDANNREDVRVTWGPRRELEFLSRRTFASTEG